MSVHYHTDRSRDRRSNSCKSDDSFPRTKGYRDLQSEKINEIKDSIDKFNDLIDQKEQDQRRSKKETKSCYLDKIQGLETKSRYGVGINLNVMEELAEERKRRPTRRREPTAGAGQGHVPGAAQGHVPGAAQVEQESPRQQAEVNKHREEHHTSRESRRSRRDRRHSSGEWIDPVKEDCSIVNNRRSISITLPTRVGEGIKQRRKEEGRPRVPSNELRVKSRSREDVRYISNSIQDLDITAAGDTSKSLSRSKKLYKSSEQLLSRTGQEIEIKPSRSLSNSKKLYKSSESLVKPAKLRNKTKSEKVRTHKRSERRAQDATSERRVQDVRDLPERRDVAPVVSTPAPSPVKEDDPSIHRRSINDEKAAIAGTFGKHFVPRRYDMSQRADRKKAASSIHPATPSDEVETMDSEVLQGNTDPNLDDLFTHFTEIETRNSRAKHCSCSDLPGLDDLFNHHNKFITEADAESPDPKGSSKDKSSRTALQRREFIVSQVLPDEDTLQTADKAHSSHVDKVDSERRRKKKKSSTVKLAKSSRTSQERLNKAPIPQSTQLTEELLKQSCDSVFNSAVPDNLCISTENTDHGRPKQSKDNIFIENVDRRAKSGKRRGTSVIISPNSTRNTAANSSVMTPQRPSGISPTPHRIVSPVPQRSVILSPVKAKRRVVISPTPQRPTMTSPTPQNSVVMSPTSILQQRSAIMSPPQHKRAPRNNIQNMINNMKKKVKAPNEQSCNSRNKGVPPPRARTPSEEYQEHSLSSSGEEVVPTVKEIRRSKKRLQGLTSKEDIKRTLSLEGLNTVLDSEDEDELDKLLEDIQVFVEEKVKKRKKSLSSKGLTGSQRKLNYGPCTVHEYDPQGAEEPMIHVERIVVPKGILKRRPE